MEDIKFASSTADGEYRAKAAKLKLPMNNKKNNKFNKNNRNNDVQNAEVKELTPVQEEKLEQTVNPSIEAQEVFKEVQEEKENRQFGKNMARVADIAILVGMKRSKPIVEGLRVGGFNDMNIHVVPNLDEATKKLAELTKKGDVILFENDLPDNYNE
jgi:hypothetical protein